MPEGGGAPVVARHRCSQNDCRDDNTRAKRGDMLWKCFRMSLPLLGEKPGIPKVAQNRMYLECQRQREPIPREAITHRGRDLDRDGQCRLMES